MIASYRHHPGLRSCAGAVADVCWRREPSLTAFRTIRFPVEMPPGEIAVPISATPVVVDDVGILVVSGEGCMRFYKEDLSKIFWERKVQARLYASPIYVEAFQQFVIASQRGHVVALDLLGHVRWHAVVEHAVYGSPGIDLERDALYLSTFGQQLHAFDLRTGAPRWTAPLPAPWSAALRSPQAVRDPYASPVVGDDGAIYLTSAEHVSCFEPDGRLRWRLDTGHTVRASAAVDAQTRTCVIAPVHGEIWLVDTAELRVRRKIVTGGKVVHSPAIAGGVAFVGNELGRVLAIDLTSADVVWTREVGSALDHGSMTFTPIGDVVFVTTTGNALCLAREDGAFLWETSQILDEPDHDRRMNATPIITNRGTMVSASYAGYVYKFQFRPNASVDPAGEGAIVVAR